MAKAAASGKEPKRAIAVGRTAIDTCQTIVAVEVGPGFRATVNGLDIDGTPDFPAWETAIRNLPVVEKGSPFAIGDAIRYGEARFGERAAQAYGPEQGWSEKTVGVYTWLSERIPSENRRMDRLGIRHHMLVAKLTSAKQRLWLTRAAADGEEKSWTVARLRKAIEEGQDVPPSVWYVLVGPLASGQIQSDLMDRLEAEKLPVKAIERRKKVATKEPAAA